MDIADHPNVAVCWNSNDMDLEGGGLEHNFNLVKDRFGATAHVRELNNESYPYQELMRLFVAMEYNGWIMLEASSTPADPIAALIEQRELFEKLVSNAVQAA
jgi:sugar phosphate isomerase/epimerase